MKRRALLLAALLAASGGLHAQTDAAAGRVYTPGPFDSIEISGSAEVRLQQGATDEIFVEGDADVQKQVELRVRGSRLRIDTSGGWKFWSSRRMQIVITVRQLSRLLISGAATVHGVGPLKAETLSISISGSGLARFDQIEAEKLSFGASGSGDAEIAGRVGALVISVSGRSDFRGEQLAARAARVSVAGVGDIKLWVLDALTVSVSGIGQVEYWGSPQVSRSSSGMAKVIERGPKPAP